MTALRVFGVILIAMLAIAATSFTCGTGGETQTGGGGGGGQQGDDDEDGDTTGCTDAINFIYTACGLFFYDAQQLQMTADQALSECLALCQTSDAWVCRLNCAKGTDTCQMLYDCLVYCPTDQDYTAQ